MSGSGFDQALKKIAPGIPVANAGHQPNDPTHPPNAAASAADGLAKMNSVAKKSGQSSFFAAFAEPAAHPAHGVPEGPTPEEADAFLKKKKLFEAAQTPQPQSPRKIPAGAPKKIQSGSLTSSGSVNLNIPGGKKGGNPKQTSPRADETVAPAAKSPPSSPTSVSPVGSPLSTSPEALTSPRPAETKTSPAPTPASPISPRDTPTSPGRTEETATAKSTSPRDPPTSSRPVLALPTSPRPEPATQSSPRPTSPLPALPTSPRTADAGATGTAEAAVVSSPATTPRDTSHGNTTENDSEEDPRHPPDSDTDPHDAALDSHRAKGRDEATTTDADTTEDESKHEQNKQDHSASRGDVGSEDEEEYDHFNPDEQLSLSPGASPSLSRSNSSGEIIKPLDELGSLKGHGSNSGGRLFSSTPALSLSAVEKALHAHNDDNEDPPSASRVFVFEQKASHGSTINIVPSWRLHNILEAASRKVNRQVHQLFYKNGVEITTIADLRENDELYVQNPRDMDAALAPLAGSNPVPITPPDSPSQSKKNINRKFDRRPKANSTASPSSSSTSSTDGSPVMKKRTSRGEIGKKGELARKTSIDSPTPKRAKRGSTARAKNSAIDSSKKLGAKKSNPGTPSTPRSTRLGSTGSPATPERRISAAEWAASVSSTPTSSKSASPALRARRLSRSESETEAKLLMLEQQRRDALARIAGKKAATSTGGSAAAAAVPGSAEDVKLTSEFAASWLPGTRIKRQHVEVATLLRDMRRSKSEPDISLLANLPSWVNTRPRAATGHDSRHNRSNSINSSLTDNTSNTLSSTDTGDASDNEDEDDFNKEASPFDLVDEGNKEINPLTISDEEVKKRMSVEEKEDLENVLIQEDTANVKAGTLRALTRRLNTHLQETEFVDSFLLTYDLFIDPVTLLKTLILQFRAPFTTEEGVEKPTLPRSGSSFGTGSSPNLFAGANSGTSTPTDASPNRRAVIQRRESNVGISGTANNSPPTGSPNVSNAVHLERQRLVIQYRIITIIKKWIEWRYEKVSRRKSWVALMDEFCSWLDKSVSDKLKSWAVILSKAMKDTRRLHSNLKKQLERLAVSILPPIKLDGASPYKKFTDIPADDLARQLTLLEQEDFARITIAEYSHLNFSKKDKEKKAPHVVSIIGRFNKMSYWMASVIINSVGMEQTPKSRAAIITHIISTMEQLLQLKNYSTTLQLFSALNMSCISRMTKTWGLVSSKSRAAMEEVNKVFFSGGPNNKVYREQLEFVEAPCIPLQDVFCRDLTFIEENPTILENGWINFEKMLLLGKTFKNLKRLQAAQYDFTVIPAIHHFLNSQISLPEGDLFDKSKALEPSEAQKAALAEKEKEEKEKQKLEKKREKEEKKLAAKAEKQEKDSQKATLRKAGKSLSSTPIDYVFEKLLEHKELWNQFRKYLQGIHAEECLDFYTQVITEYKKCDFADVTPDGQTRIKESAQRIVAAYISLAGQYALSIPDSARGTIERTVKAGKSPMSEKVFDVALGDITFQLKSHFNTFKKTVETGGK